MQEKFFKGDLGFLFDKNKKNGFSIAAYEYPKSVSIIFLYSNDKYEVETESENKFENIFVDYTYNIMLGLP